MTKEEAIRELRIQFVGEYDRQREAKDMAIRALEQESVIDKIEKEINSPNRGTCDYFVIDRIEEIIKEYKAGREE